MLFLYHYMQKNIKFKIRGSFVFGTTEKKLLIVFCYYLVTAVISLTASTMGTRNASQSVRNFQDYFFCEQGGYNPDNPCTRSGIEDLTYPSINTFSYMLLSLLPAANLLYAVDYKKLKEFWKSGSKTVDPKQS